MSLLDIAGETKPHKGKLNHKDENLFSSTNASDVRRICALMEARSGKSAGSGMQSDVITITPAMAEYLLKNHNKGNRNISPYRAEKYARQMKDGAFKLTSQGISFDPSGNLNNGQHRLTGVVLSGCPVKMYVTWGEDRSAFSVIDTGGARSGGDVLSIVGYTNTKRLAAAVRVLNAIEGGLRSRHKFALTNDQIIDFVASRPKLQDATILSGRIVKKFHCGSAPIASAIYLILEKSKRPELLSAFLGQLIDGNGLDKNAPLLKLRDGMQSATIGAGLDDSGSRAVFVAATIVITWNKWVKGRVGGITWKTSDPFPAVE